MRNNELVKRLLVAFMVATVVLALLPTAVFAQEATEEAHSEESADAHGAETADAHGAEEAASSEGESSSGGLAALGINQGFLMAQIVNFSILLLILSPFLRGAVTMLDNRSAEIQKGLEDAAAAAKARQNAEAEADKILAEARAERQKLLEEARQQGDGVKKQIESEARQEAERLRTEAQQEAVAVRNAELASLRDQVLNISTAVAGRILQENIDAKKQSQLVSDFFAKLPEGAKNLSGDVEVISAMPLSDAEKKTLEGQIKAAGFTYSVDTAILGGLIIRSQDRVIDGSVRTNLGGVTGRLR